MNVVHVKKTRNNTIRSIPITGNYLVREKSGMLRWAEPNDSFSMFSNTGGNRQVMTNIRLDDTEHSADLFLYTNVAKKDDEASDIMKNSRVHLDRTRKWYLRQFVEIDRPGIRRFTGLPLNVFLQWWRKPMPASHFSLTGLNNDQVRLMFGDYTKATSKEWFNIFVKWPELQADIENSTPKAAHRKSAMHYRNTRESERVVPWLRKHCLSGFIPFSDYDSMFLDAEDEVLYITDLLG